MAAALAFDPARLAVLQRQVPANLQILRLRLRFSLPVTLRIGQRFRVSLELVDEMGQSAAQSIQQSVLGDLEARIHPEMSAASASVELKIRELANANAKAKSAIESCRWSFDAEFALGTESSSQGRDESGRTQDLGEAIMLLRLGLKPHAHRALTDQKTEFHSDFQQFCVHSEWIDAETLVLPIQTQHIRLLLSTSAAHQTQVGVHVAEPTSRLCSRVFSISRHLHRHSKCGSPAGRQTITIQENYGDTMGSHIWDASLLLAFALCTASHFPKSLQPQDQDQDYHVMLELGAGCGLFAAVHAALSEQLNSERASTKTMTILTERTESMELLRANLRLNSRDDRAVAEPNDVTEAIRYLPLIWGDHIEEKAIPAAVDAIFASDVLYNWNAHEPLLRTIDELQRLHSDSAARCAQSVVVAHKHRGSNAASSVLLEKLVCGSAADRSEAYCTLQSTAEECQWANWDVTRAARLGRVDLLLLTRSSKVSKPTTESA